MEKLNRSGTLQRNAEQILLGKKTNCLLVKDDVGRAKPTTRDLPQNAFAFGKPELLPTRETAYDGKLPLQNILSLMKFL